MKYLIAVFLFFNTISLIAQDNSLDKQDFVGRWDLGLNFGVYLPSNYHAKFYDGSEENVNKISYVFGNKYWYEDIKRELNASDTVFVRELPTNMRYNAAFQVGIYLRRTFDNYLGFSLQFDYSKLTAADVYTLEIDPNYIGSEPDIHIYNIWGVEERVNIDLLFSKYFKTKNPIIIPFFEGGLNITSTKVKEHKIKVENLEYSLVNTYINGSYVPGAAQNSYEIYQGGMGVGFSVAAGIKFQLSQQFSFDPGIRIYYQKIKLEGYDVMKPAFSIFFRLSLADFFSSYE
ncbi:MAG: hypothetical protein DRI86_13050 [Bacteroidetes bacterium]|nr:MAG: hypothetical protein DRI86_13050 [Bacteroidota bacterium]